MLRESATNGAAFILEEHLTGDEALDEKLREWLRWDQNETTRQEIESLVITRSHERLRKLLSTRLAFGTAGIRGVMGAGFAAMNDLVIIQTTQGMVQYLLQTHPEVRDKGVILGFDARHNSQRFAKRAAVAFLQKDIPVYLYSAIVPTPFIPFGIKLLKAAAGVMVTASHNPKADNGYKVYFSNGAQIKSPHDKGIQFAIEANLKPWDKAWELELISKTKDPLEEVKKEYFKQIEARIFDKQMIVNTDLKFAYTSLHGVGHNFVTEAFRTCGFPAYFPVKEQQEPDPEFPTVSFPNPEEGKGVLNLSFKTADATGSSLILANDPDTDRCAVAEKQKDGTWRVFTGNEVGALLGWWCWFIHKATDEKTPAADAHMISSAVSSKILQTMAKKEGFTFIETLTGFKWMGNRADELLNQGKKVLFAFEEAIGYMTGTHVLDKDGISAAVEVAQLAAYVRASRGFSLSDHLNHIFNVYGYHCSLNSYYLCDDPTVIKRIFTRLANFEGPDTYPKAMGKYKINRVRDLNRGYDNGMPGNVPELPASSSTYMLTFYFENGVVLTIRNSGTEPKVKYYTEAIAPPEDKKWDVVEKMMIDLVWNMVNICLEPEKNGLKPKAD